MSNECTCGPWAPYDSHEWSCPRNPQNECDAILRRILEWADDQMQALPEHRNPVAHGKAELLTDLRHLIARGAEGDNQ